ncbi:MAG: hypothetical protein GY939_07335, partial [Actinomycetia bacterium]|nr:hypothetical protein [Actinomycetes bacterium]
MTVQDGEHRRGAAPASSALRADHYQRPRLTQLMEDGRSPVVVVVAPAGFGKTTAVADWLETTEHPSSWISLEDRDDDLMIFFTRVANAIEPVCGRGRLQGLVSSSSGLAAAGIMLASAAAEDLEAAHEGTVIVVEDLHHISSEPVLHALEFLINHLPPHVRLALLSRFDPPVALARLRAAGQLTELRAADLAFTPAESEELLAAAGQPIPSALVARLNERIEGWAVGLRMAALSLTGRTDVEEFVDSFSGDDRFVADYLLEEVLNREPERVQRFLLESSLLDEMTAELCDTVMDTHQSGETLDDLFTRNLFVVRTGSGGDCFRYHQLFAELLRARIHRREPERVTEVLRSAAAWCEQDGDLDQALRYLIKAGDTDAAAELAARRAPRLLMQGDIGRHRAWLGLFPPTVVDHDPRLLLTRAWSELFADQPQEALHDLARAERLAPEGFFGSRAGHLELIRAIAAWFDGRHVECVEHGHRSLELLAESDLGSICVSHLYCGIGELVVGQSSEAIQHLDEAMNLADQVGNDYTAFSARVAAGAVSVRDGELDRARYLFLSALDLARDLETGGRQFPIGGAGHLGRGVVAFEQFDLETAAEAFRQALVELRKTTTIDYTSLAYRRWAEAQSLQGDHGEAAEIIDEARHHLAGFGQSKALIQGLDSCEARVALRAGDPERAIRLHERSASIPQRGQREFDNPQFEQYSTGARLDLAGGRPDRAEQHLASMRLLTGDRVEHRIEVATMEAAILDALGRTVEATD